MEDVEDIKSNIDEDVDSLLAPDYWFSDLPCDYMAMSYAVLDESGHFSTSIVIYLSQIVNGIEDTTCDLIDKLTGIIVHELIHIEVHKLWFDTYENYNDHPDIERICMYMSFEEEWGLYTPKHPSTYILGDLRKMGKDE